MLQERSWLRADTGIVTMWWPWYLPHYIHCKCSLSIQKLYFIVSMYPIIIILQLYIVNCFIGCVCVVAVWSHCFIASSSHWWVVVISYKHELCLGLTVLNANAWRSCSSEKRCYATRSLRGSEHPGPQSSNGPERDELEVSYHWKNVSILP